MLRALIVAYILLLPGVSFADSQEMAKKYLDLFLDCSQTETFKVIKSEMSPEVTTDIIVLRCKDEKALYERYMIRAIIEKGVTEEDAAERVRNITDSLRVKILGIIVSFRENNP